MLKNIHVIIMLMMTTPIAAQKNTVGKIEVFDARMHSIVEQDAIIEVLTDDMQWAEGPVWVEQQRCLLFSDPKQNTIFKWTAAEGTTAFLKPSGYTGLGAYSDEPGSNGLLINLEGDLVACEHGDRRISQMNLTKGGKVTLADRWDNKRLNSPNDICQHRDGTYYFTDPPYGLPEREADTQHRETPIHGVYRLNTSNTVEQIISNLARPNGIALSADEKLLYVAQSFAAEPYIMAYPLQEGDLSQSGSILFNFKTQFPQQEAYPDGIKVDAAGNIFAGAADGIVVIGADGVLLGRIYIGTNTANCAFSDDGYLYITASNYVLRVKLKSLG